VPDGAQGPGVAPVLWPGPSCQIGVPRIALAPDPGAALPGAGRNPGPCPPARAARQNGWSLACHSGRFTGVRLVPR